MARPKFIQAAKTFLKTPITSTETGSIVIGALNDIYGNTLSVSDFSSVLRFTFSPGNSDEEIITCTNFTRNADGSVTLDTGIVRGLQAKYPYTSGGTPSSHSAGTIVVILPDNPQLYEEIVAYIDTIALASAVPASDTAVGYTKLTKDLSSLPRAQAALVSQQSTPGMTLRVQPFSFVADNINVTYAGGNTGTFSAPTVNPRRDLVVYDTVNSIIAIRTGSEAASPSIPTPTAGDIVLCSVHHLVGETTLLERTSGGSGYILAWYEPGIYTTSSTISSLITYTTDTDQSQATQNTTTTVGEANATTKHSLIAEKFVPSDTTIRGVKLYKSADTGSFTGTVKVALQADTAGNPSGSDLASLTITNAAWLKITAGEFSMNFTSQYTTLTSGGSYWIVISTSTGDNSNHPNFGANSAGGYASGVLKYNNSTDGWVTISTTILYFKTLIGTLSKIPKTDATTGLIPTALRPYSLIDFTSTVVTITNTGTETTLYSKLIEGGMFSTTAGFRVKAFIRHTTGAAGSGSFSVDLKLKVNGTSLGTATTCTVINTNGAVTATNYYELMFVNNASLSSQNVGWSLLSVPITPGGTPTVANSFGGGTAVGTTATIDTTQPMLIELTGTMSSTNNAAWTVTLQAASLEKIG